MPADVDAKVIVRSNTGSDVWGESSFAMMMGPNVQATARLLKVCKTVPIVHSGGVTTLADVTALKDLPIQGIIVCKAIYEGTLNVADAVKALAA